MKGFDDIVRSANLAEKINKSLGLSSVLSEALETRTAIKGFTGINMLAEISKSIRVPNVFGDISKVAESAKRNWELNSVISPFSALVDLMTKSVDLKSNIGIPQTTLDAIASIHNQHEQIFGGIRGLVESAKIQSLPIAQINNLHYALGGISQQIVASAAIQKNWAIIEDFEQVSGKAIDFTDSLTNEITEEQQRKFQMLIALVVAFVKKNKMVGVSALLLIDIFLRFAGIHQYYDFLKDKPEPASSSEVNQVSIKQDSVQYFLNLVSEEFKKVNECRSTNRACEVKLKPKSKTLTLTQLPRDFQVIVVQVHHKWVYISYFDPKDNLPQMGWVMKKYLSVPNQK